MNLEKFLVALTESEREELKALLNTDMADDFFDAMAGDNTLTKHERWIRRAKGKINAIKAVRERTALGLKESKELVERECPDIPYALPACPRCGDWKNVRLVGTLVQNFTYREDYSYNFHCFVCDKTYKGNKV